MNVAAIVGLALLFSSVAQAAETVLGPLTLAYDAASWHVTAVDDGAMFHCAADGCEPTPVAIQVVTDGGASCSRDAMYDAVAAAFPNASRSGVNPRGIGNLVLYLGLASHGPLLEDPGAVRACVAHDGASIHITSRVEGGWPGVDHASRVTELLHGLRAPPGEMRELVVGGLAFRYDSARWQPRDQQEEGWVLACLPPACAPEAQVTVTVRPSGEACPVPPPDGEIDAEVVQVEAHDGLAFALATVRSGCRNMVPPLHRACALHDGRTYIIETGDHGCRTAPGVPLDSMRELIAGAGLVDQ